MLVDLLVPNLQYIMALNNSLSLEILVRLFLIEWIPSNRYTRFSPSFFVFFSFPQRSSRCRQNWKWKNFVFSYSGSWTSPQIELYASQWYSLWCSLSTCIWFVCVKRQFSSNKALHSRVALVRPYLLVEGHTMCYTRALRDTECDVWPF